MKSKFNETHVASPPDVAITYVVYALSPMTASLVFGKHVLFFFLFIYFYLVLKIEHYMVLTMNTHGNRDHDNMTSLCNYCCLLM